MAISDVLYKACLEHFTANPSEIDPKFGGDPAKAAAAFAESGKTMTQLFQELAQIKKTTPAPAPSPNPTAPSGIQIPEPPREDINQILTRLKSEVVTNGDASNATKDALVRTGGYTLDSIAMLVAGIRTGATQQINEAVTLLGTKDEYDRVIGFAATLPAAEVSHLRNALSGPGWQTVLLGIQARMVASRGIGTSREGTPINHVPGNSGVTKMVFLDYNQYLAAFRDPKYYTDPAYRDAVAVAAADFMTKNPKMTG
jgi:hypothetical protein